MHERLNVINTEEFASMFISYEMSDKYRFCLLYYIVFLSNRDPFDDLVDTGIDLSNEPYDIYDPHDIYEPRKLVILLLLRAIELKNEIRHNRTIKKKLVQKQED